MFGEPLGEYLTKTSRGTFHDGMEAVPLAMRGRPLRGSEIARICHCSPLTANSPRLCRGERLPGRRGRGSRARRADRNPLIRVRL